MKTTQSQFIEKNWNNFENLRLLIGQPYVESFPGELKQAPHKDGIPAVSWCFGKIPTNKVEVLVANGVIFQITTWDGLEWSAQNGRVKPYMVVK